MRRCGCLAGGLNRGILRNDVVMLSTELIGVDHVLPSVGKEMIETISKISSVRCKTKILQRSFHG